MTTCAVGGTASNPGNLSSVRKQEEQSRLSQAGSSFTLQSGQDSNSLQQSHTHVYTSAHSPPQNTKGPHVADSSCTVLSMQAVCGCPAGVAAQKRLTRHQARTVKNQFAARHWCCIDHHGATRSNMHAATLQQIHRYISKQNTKGARRECSCGTTPANKQSSVCDATPQPACNQSGVCMSLFWQPANHPPAPGCPFTRYLS